MVATWLRERPAHPNGTTGGTMKRAIYVALATGAVISSAAAIGIGAAAVAPAENINLTRAQYEAGLRAIADRADTQQLACGKLVPVERDVCRAEAAGLEAVLTAQLEARYRKTPHAERAAQRARIDARYQLDRARCSAVNGVRRDRCLVQAHATKGRALLEAAAPYEVRF
jgi:hypothetical protein